MYFLLCAAYLLKTFFHLLVHNFDCFVLIFIDVYIWTQKKHPLDARIRAVEFTVTMKAYPTLHKVR
jgi:hypothetical protein